ncbi:MAG: hypothetical protein KAX50_06005 [Saprospiraceae bacterium]|nr:hypothetical protein [Saprospiraceae bacterium]
MLRSPAPTRQVVPPGSRQPPPFAPLDSNSTTQTANAPGPQATQSAASRPRF